MIRLRVLGATDLHDSDGRELRAVLAQPKRLAVLAYLAASQGAFHRRDTLLALFWPELDDRRAREALNSTIHFLRKQLDTSRTDSVVVSRGASELGVDADRLWCDVAAFREHVAAGRHADALDLYRGDFLHGFFSEQSDGFNEWMDTERASIRATAAKAARALAELREHERSFTTAVASARRAVDLSGTDERVVRELLELLDRLGDRAGALHAFTAFERRLADEYDASPAAETVALVQRIRARVKPTVVAPTSVATESAELNNWRIERELARGGMSTVYLAHDAKHDRPVALKTLRWERAQPLSAERFLREIQITARLAHPHILPLIDSGAADGVLYLVTPYLEGESLRDRLRRGSPMSIDEAMRITSEIAEALDYAHRSGVIHRDIKPENILLADGHAIVADFGVARALDASGVVRTIPDSDPEAIVGSRDYMSPEQVAGSGVADGRADIFALGCVAFEMLTGQRASAGTRLGDVLRLRPEVPAAIAAVVSSCLAEQPERRPVSAADVLGELENGVAQRPRASAALLAVAAVALLTSVGAFVVWPRGNTTGQLHIDLNVPIAASSGIEIEPAISPDGERIAFLAGEPGRLQVFVRDVAGGHAIPISKGVDGNHRWPRWSPDAKRILFEANGAAYVVPAVGGTPEVLIENPAGVITPAWSPDGRQLGYADRNGLWIRRADGGEPRQVVAATTSLHSLAWSPDGRMLAFLEGNRPQLETASQTSVWVVPAAGGERILIADARSFQSSPIWTPDGDNILFVSSRDGTPDVFQQAIDEHGRPRGSPVRLTTGLFARTITLASDGSRLAYDVVRRRANVWSAPVTADVTPWSAAHQITNENWRVLGTSISHDGKWLAFDASRAGGTSDIYKVLLSGGEPVRVTAGPRSKWSPTWSPDDREIAFYSSENGDRDIRMTSAAGGDEHAVTSGPRQDYAPDWSPDGRHIAFYGRIGSELSGKNRVYVTTKTGNAAWSAPQPLTSEGNMISPKWSPDGRWIVYCDGRRGVTVVAPSGGQSRVVADVSAMRENLQGCAWGRNGSGIFFNSTDSLGRYSFWEVSSAGGTPRLILRGDSTHRVGRFDFATDGKQIYFTLAADEDDVWMMRLKR